MGIPRVDSSAVDLELALSGLRIDGFAAPIPCLSGPMLSAVVRESKRLLTALSNDVVPHVHLRSNVLVAALVPLARDLQHYLGNTIAIEGSHLIQKRAHSEFRVPFHQDGINQHTQLDPGRAISLFLAVTESHTSNGGLQVVPRSHHNGFLNFRRSSSDDTQASSGQPLEIATTPGIPVSVELAAGAACLLDVRTIHCSGPNRTAHPRLGLNVRLIAPGAFQRIGSHRGAVLLVGDPDEFGNEVPLHASPTAVHDSEAYLGG